MKFGLTIFLWLASVLVTACFLKSLEDSPSSIMTCRTLQHEPDLVEECSNEFYRIYIINHKTYHIEDGN